jgi:hypothetical protein
MHIFSGRMFTLVSDRTNNIRKIVNLFKRKQVTKINGENYK